MRHHIAFRQHNPKKLHRYVLLWKSLIDARLPYTYKSVPYDAKPHEGDGPHYIKTTIDYVKYLFQGMEKQQLFKNSIISTDRLYLSIEPGNWLLALDITTVGTLQRGRQGILSEIFDTKDKDEFSSNCHFEKDKKGICLTSYTVKTK